MTLPDGIPAFPLTEEQRRVTTSDADRILILAGAGSGKTRVIVQRVAHLVTSGCPPEGIVLLTFTLRAARQMRTRLAESLGPAANRVQAGTFHALAYALLRAHGDDLDLPSGWSVASPAQQLEVMDRAMQTTSRKISTPRRLLELSALSINTQATLQQTCERQAPQLRPELDLVEVIFDHYAAEKSALGLLDFDDLLLLFKALLLRPGSQMQAWRETLRHVLVDEYQDTTPLQAELAQLLCDDGAHLVAVGDDAQSIYGFRGAEVQNILRFPEVAKTQTYALTRCFRSQSKIVDAAQALIRRNQEQFNTPLHSQIPPGPNPAIVMCTDEAQQSAFIAKRIIEHAQSGLPLGDMGVLFRTHAQGECLQQALTHAQIPFLVRGGPSVLSLPHIQQALAFVRLMVEPTNTKAWGQVLQGLPGVGPTTAQALTFELGDCDRPAESLTRLAPSAQRVQPQLLRLAEAFDDLDSCRPAPRDILMKLLEDAHRTKTGYLHSLRTIEIELNAAAEQVRLLAVQAGAHDDIRAFLAHLALDSDPDVPPDDDAVTLSTVHQAKGLEWSTVFVMGLAEGLFPLRYALAEAGGEEQERRLLYVAMTRAKDALYLCAPSLDSRGGQLSPARYLFELPVDGTERWSLTG